MEALFWEVWEEKLEKQLSPNARSDKLNQTLGVTTGGTIGLLVGLKAAESLWEQHPENTQRKTLLFPDSPDNGQVKIRVIRPQRH